MKTVFSQGPASRVHVPRHDMHVHTCHCNHTDDDATFGNYVARAVEYGIEYLGFAEHFGRPEDNEVFRLIRRDIDALDLPPDAPLILVGAEMDADPRDPDGGYLAGEVDVELDHVILAEHAGLQIGQPTGERLEPETLSAGERERYGAMWLDWYQACIESGRYDIMAHPMRSSLGPLLSLDDEATFTRMVGIFQRAAERGMTMEFNCGWNYQLLRRGHFSRFIELVKEGKAAGLKFCISSDAHAMEHFWTTDLSNEAQVETNLSPLRYIEAAGLVADDWIDPQVFLDRQRQSSCRQS